MENIKNIDGINIYDFINSVAIARYCRNIGHLFTPLQEAYIINNSRRHTLAEKHQTFQWLIENRQDDEISISTTAGKDRHAKNVSLKWFLKEYTSVQNTYRTLSNKEEEIIESFEQVCFVCPTPFKKGDIVWIPSYEEDEPFVFLHAWYEDMDKESRIKYINTHDSSDMVAYGYFLNKAGSIFFDCIHDYLSLEYYSGSFEGKKRILKAVSNFLKEELDLGSILNAYHIIMNEERANEIKGHMCLTEEGLHLAGLI